jgi:hypothetical protein
VALVVGCVEFVKVDSGMLECLVLRRRSMYGKRVKIVGGMCGKIFGI